MVALRILGLAWTTRKQIGNTGLGGCNRRTHEKNTASEFCLFSAALNRESYFFKNKFDNKIATDLSIKHIHFLETFFYLSSFLVLNSQ